MWEMGTAGPKGGENPHQVEAYAKAEAGGHFWVPSWLPQALCEQISQETLQGTNHCIQ